MTVGEWLAMHPQVKSQLGEQYHIGKAPAISIKKLHNLLPTNGRNNEIMVLKKGFCCRITFKVPRESKC